ncbi:MAG TPA: metal-dependent phosphohydrolase, partial [Arthrobacter sp.]
IIDGHDSRREALSIEDAIVKDADKTWRLSPHGLDTVMDWFGLDRGQALRLCSQRVHGHLFTAEAKAMARALSALESVTLWPQRQALPG